ncbi:MAG: trehalose-6-phosphate synthase [Pseudomonadota bacterium]
MRIVAVSNRIADPNKGKAAGGLAVGVLGALEKFGGMWFGWNGKISAESQDPKVTQHGAIDFATIPLTEKEFHNYYNGYCNDTLWPLFHCMLGFLTYDKTQYETYRRVNGLFARKLLPLLEDDDIIWVHDYHLIPLAQELKHAGATQRIGFFLHVPFPSPDILRALPKYREILQALCRFDLVGFHTDHDLRAFQQCMCEPEVGGRLLSDNRIEAHGHVFKADVFPIGIEVDQTIAMAEESRSTEELTRVVDSLDGREMIIGVDRLDYSKGLPARFLSYERWLQDYPENRGQVTFVQIAPPSRTGVRAYDDIRQELEGIAGHINGRFAEIDWVPIRYLNQGYGRKTLMGIFGAAKIGLVTSLRDGMNLVAKEYVASQPEHDPGVLVLSRLTGAARELSEAIQVNPYDIDGVATGLQTAITMSVEERRERHQSMLATLRRHDIHTWTNRFIDALQTPN